VHNLTKNLSRQNKKPDDHFHVSSGFSPFFLKTLSVAQKLGQARIIITNAFDCQYFR